MRSGACMDANAGLGHPSTIAFTREGKPRPTSHNTDLHRLHGAEILD